MAVITQNSTAKRGFTIIEVVLVLAIAGLIFIVVFFALPTLQRAQRDTQRRQDLAEIMGAFQTWRSNNLGKLIDTPEELTAFRDNYLKEKYDPSTGEQYNFIILAVGGNHVTDDLIPDVGTVVYHVGHICGSDDDAVTYTKDSPIFSATVKQFAVVTRLELGGVYCLDVE